MEYIDKLEESSILVYHGTNYETLIDNKLDMRSYVSTDKWCAESYGKYLFTFRCNINDLVPDNYGLPPEVETNIFRIKRDLIPLENQLSK